MKMRFPGILMILASLAMFPTPASASWLEFFGLEHSVTLRYKVKVTLSFGGENRTGSAVWQAQFKTGPGILPNETLESLVRGEAIAIPGPDGKTYFVLRKQIYLDRPTTEVGFSGRSAGDFVRTCVKANFHRETIEALRRFEGTCLARFHPTIVTFDDTSDPSTIHPVLYNDLSPVWTGGITPRTDYETDIALVSVTATATDSLITTGIVLHLPWLADMGPYADIMTGEPMLETGFGSRVGHFYAQDFSTEITDGYSF